MQKLHVIGFTPELDGLIFSTRAGSSSGTYVADLDDRFVELVRHAVQHQADIDLREKHHDARPSPSAELAECAAQAGSPPAGSGRASALSPREIQARLRAGRTSSDVAREAAVEEAWVLRFAPPVLAEQRRIIARALAAPCSTARRGSSSQPLERAVALNLVERGLRLTADELASAWSASLLRDQVWVVALSYSSRTRPQVAKWEFDAARGALVAMDRLASDLGFVPAARRLLVDGPEPEAPARPTNRRRRRVPADVPRIKGSPIHAIGPPVRSTVRRADPTARRANASLGVSAGASSSGR